MSWVSAPDWAALSLDCMQRSPKPEPSVSSRKTNSVSKSSWPASPALPSGTMSCEIAGCTPAEIEMVKAQALASH